MILLSDYMLRANADSFEGCVLIKHRIYIQNNTLSHSLGQS